MRALPWVHEARDNDPTFLDCDHCMETLTPAMRATLRCGFMPAAAHVDGQRWSPADGTELTVCAGYSTSLPDVIDVACSYAHWENGALDHACPGGAAKPLLQGIVMLKSATERRATFRMREQADKARQRGGG